MQCLEGYGNGEKLGAGCYMEFFFSHIVLSISSSTWSWAPRCCFQEYFLKLETVAKTNDAIFKSWKHRKCSFCLTELTCLKVLGQVFSSFQSRYWPSAAIRETFFQIVAVFHLIADLVSWEVWSSPWSLYLYLHLCWPFCDCTINWCKMLTQQKAPHLFLLDYYFWQLKELAVGNREDKESTPRLTMGKLWWEQECLFHQQLAIRLAKL